MNKFISPFYMSILVFFLSGILVACSENPTDEPLKINELTKIFDLPGEMSETSGIIVFDSLLWSFNDSGDDKILYGVDLSTGEIRKRIHLANVTHIDWEDITQDQLFIYLGDFGNNSGTRTDLCIYKINKDSIIRDADQILTCEKISYFYEDQVDFSVQINSTPFDCEALFTIGDSLFIFTKNWTENITGLYRLPKEPGIYSAKKICDFESEGLITGADFDPETNELVICGYREYVPFIVYFGGAQNLNLEEIPKEKTYIFDHFGLQVEGITTINSIIYVSAENSAENQALFEFVTK
jgi:hypothetical protein